MTSSGPGGCAPGPGPINPSTPRILMTYRSALEMLSDARRHGECWGAMLERMEARGFVSRRMADRLKKAMGTDCRCGRHAS